MLDFCLLFQIFEVRKSTAKLWSKIKRIHFFNINRGILSYFFWILFWERDFWGILNTVENENWNLSLTP